MILAIHLCQQQRGQFSHLLPKPYSVPVRTLGIMPFVMVAIRYIYAPLSSIKAQRSYCDSKFTGSGISASTALIGITAPSVTPLRQTYTLDIALLQFMDLWLSQYQFLIISSITVSTVMVHTVLLRDTALGLSVIGISVQSATTLIFALVVKLLH